MGASAIPRRSPASRSTPAAGSSVAAIRAVSAGTASHASRQPILPHAHRGPPSVPTVT